MIMGNEISIYNLSRIAWKEPQTDEKVKEDLSQWESLGRPLR